MYPNYDTIMLISHASKVLLKILQAHLQQYANWEIPEVQAGFRKGRVTRDQIVKIQWIMEKAREYQENKDIYFTDYSQAFDCVHQTIYGKLLQRKAPVSWETCLQDKKHQLEPDVKQQTDSKLGKEYIKAVYCHLLI